MRIGVFVHAAQLRKLAPIGVLTVGIIACAGSCSSPFSTCYASRTCPPGGRGGDDSAGSGAAAGDAEAGEGGSGSPKGDESTSPRDDGGSAGETSLAELIVQSTTPDNGTSAVERNVTVEVVFSAVIDPKTVTNDTFSVVGPAGVVSGEVSVSGAKATFKPNTAWSLLADYTVSLASSIRSQRGIRLSDTESFDFHTRDGVFRRPERLTNMAAGNLQMVGSRAGHVAVAWTDNLTPASTLAVMFDPHSAKWGRVAPIASEPQNDYTLASMAFNGQGQAFAVAGSRGAAWNRFNGVSWGTASRAGIGETRFCALGDDGVAMTIWSAYVGEERRVFAQTLSSEDTWSTVETLRSNANLVVLKRFGPGFLALHQFTTEQALYSNSYDPKHGWSPPEPVGLASGSYTQGMAANETAALLLSWDTSNVATAALFNGTSWAKERLGSITGGTCASVGESGHVAAWVNQNSVYAARYDLTRGWQDPAKLGPITAEYTGPGLEIDASGNALAAWPDGSSVSWRRSPHSSTAWADTQQLEDQDPGEEVFTTVDSSGDVMLVWQNSLGVWASRFE